MKKRFSLYFIGCVVIINSGLFWNCAPTGEVGGGGDIDIITPGDNQNQPLPLPDTSNPSPSFNDVTESIPAGTYFGSVEVVLTSQLSSAHIYFTLDSSKVLDVKDEFLYPPGTKILISQDTDLRFFSVSDGKKSTERKLLYRISNQSDSDSGIYFEKPTNYKTNSDFTLRILKKAGFSIQNIYYSIDDTAHVPTTQSTLYGDLGIPLSLPQGKNEHYFNIQAVAYDAGGRRSSVIQRSFKIDKILPPLQVTKERLDGNALIFKVLNWDPLATVSYVIYEGATIPSQKTNYILDSEINLPLNKKLAVISTDDVGNVTTVLRENKPKTTPPQNLIITARQYTPESEKFHFKLFSFSNNVYMLNDDLSLEMKTDDPSDEIWYTITWDGVSNPNPEPIQGVLGSRQYNRTPGMGDLPIFAPLMRNTKVYINVRAYDLYGNYTEVKQYTFTMDRKPPTLQLALDHIYSATASPLSIDELGTIYFRTGGNGSTGGQIFKNDTQAIPSEFDPINTHKVENGAINITFPTPAPPKAGNNADRTFVIKVFAKDRFDQYTKMCVWEYAFINGMGSGDGKNWMSGYYSRLSSSCH